MIRIAMLGFWHVHAKDYAAEAQAHPDAELVAAWDEDPARGAEGAANLGIPFHADLDELLARNDVDGVIVTTRTTAHLEVILAAARGRQAHLHREGRRPDAGRGAADRRRRRAGRRDPDRLAASSHPRLHARDPGDPRVRPARDVTQVRCRLAHDGAIGRQWLPARFFDADDAGGGALVDLGCHPLYLTRLFLGGMPESVSAEYGRVTGHAVDDNAVAILRHRSGALGIAETGFVNPASPFTIEIHGTTGSLLYGTPEPRLMVRLASRGEPTGSGTRCRSRTTGRRRSSSGSAHIADGTRRHREHRPRARSHGARRCRRSVGPLGPGDRRRAAAERRPDGG